MHNRSPVPRFLSLSLLFSVFCSQMSMKVKNDGEAVLQVSRLAMSRYTRPASPWGKAAARWLRAKLSFNDILRGADVIICGDLDDPRKHRIKSEGGSLKMDRNRQPGTAD